MAGYPAYRRKNDGRTVQIGRLVADNSYVVPYNRDLLRKYRAHINVEACASVKSVKYLFKYVYKGHDCVNMEMVMEDGEVRDEIKLYLNCRYVSAPEAMWRLSEYRIVGEFERVLTKVWLLTSIPPDSRCHQRDHSSKCV